MARYNNYGGGNKTAATKPKTVFNDVAEVGRFPLYENKNGSAELRVTLTEKRTGDDADLFVNIRVWKKSESYTGPDKSGLWLEPDAAMNLRSTLENLDRSLVALLDVDADDTDY